MKYTSLILSGCAMICALGCNAQAGKGKKKAVADKDAFQSSPSGLEYKIVTKGTGTVNPQAGDFGELNLIFRIGDSMLINTHEMNQQKPVLQQFQAPVMKGDLMEGLMTMHAGDSVVFRMLMDTLAERSKQPKPPFAKPGDYAVWEVKLVSVKTKEQMEKENGEKEQVQAKIDDQLLQDYFKAKGITNAQKTASGLYYVLHKPGTGERPVDGQTATVNYTGQNLQGEKFDSNVDPQFNHVEPFSFGVGQRQVIKGWDEAALLLKKGAQATFYLPSHLAYGDRGAGGQIPPNAILIFDIELLDFK